MVEAMKKVAAMDCELTIEERNLLSVAYKNVIGARRASWRIISSLEQRAESDKNREGDKDRMDPKLIKDYREKVSQSFKQDVTNYNKAFEAWPCQVRLIRIFSVWGMDRPVARTCLGRGARSQNWDLLDITPTKEKEKKGGGETHFVGKKLTFVVIWGILHHIGYGPRDGDEDRMDLN